VLQKVKSTVHIKLASVRIRPMLFRRRAACLRFEEALVGASMRREAMIGARRLRAARSAGQQYSRTFGLDSRGLRGPGR